MNLVIGATGLLGGEICRQLRQAGKPVRALTRATADPVKVEQLKRSGATLVQGDLKDRVSLDAACRGVATVITTASTTFSRQAGDSIQTVDLESMRQRPLGFPDSSMSRTPTRSTSTARSRRRNEALRPICSRAA